MTLLAQVADPRGGVAARVLFVEDDLLRQRRAVAAVLTRPAEAGPAGRRKARVPGLLLGVRLVLAPGPARAAKRGQTPGQVPGEPLADPAPELLVLRAGPHPRLPNNGPAGPQGGLQARGSFVSGQHWPPRVGSAYQALASLEATWRS